MEMGVGMMGVGASLSGMARVVARGQQWRVHVSQTGDRAWVEFAAPTAAGRCADHPTVATAPAWEVIGTETHQVVGYELGGACSVDGELDAGWLRSGTRCVGSIRELLDHASAFLADELEERHDLAVERMERLQDELRRAVVAVEQGADVSTVVTTPGEWPGIGLRDEGLYAWAFDPRGVGAALVAGPTRPAVPLASPAAPRRWR